MSTYEQRDDNAAVDAAERAKKTTGDLGHAAKKHHQQKKSIKKRYARAKRKSVREQVSADQAAKAVKGRTRQIEETVRRVIHGKGIILLIFVLLVVYMFTSLSSCVPLGQTALQAMVIGTYPAEEDMIKDAEKVYCDMEKELQHELDHYEELHPEYDEVQIDQMELWHDPYALMALISAHAGGEWTIESVYGFMKGLFRQQYVMTTEVVTETRYNREWQTVYEQVLNPVTGELEWQLVEEMIEVPYIYKICKVKVVNKILSHLPFHVLSREQVGMYAVYMATHGNMDGLFTGRHVSKLKEPLLYDVPPEYAQADPQFGKLLEEAQKYIGYPYVWGGDSPETSFDCSGFISWILNETGTKHVGRLGATSLYGVCKPITPREARPGDLVFFQGTLGEGVEGNEGITHVGLYVGDGMMLHCGNPISFADLNRTYFRQHFYGYGRVYE